MTRRVMLRALELVALPTIALGLALAFAPDEAALAAHLWLVVVTATGLLALVAALGRTRPRPAPVFDDAAHTRNEQGLELPGLARLGRELSMATGSAYDLHVRLRPTVRELARGLLSRRHGVDLDREPERARQLLGKDTWELVRPDRPFPAERRGGGLALAEIDRIVRSLEGL